MAESGRRVVHGRVHRLDDARDRRVYRKTAIEITAIEFVPMSEVERQRAIAVLAELFLPLLKKTAPEQKAA